MTARPVFVGDRPPFYRFANAVLAAAVSAYGRFTVEGAERLPALGPAIVVANHHSDVDPIALAVGLGRPLHFMADSGQFERWFVGPIIARLGAFPVRRDRFDRDGLDLALAILDRGGVVVVFPEGEMYPDGVLRPFAIGAGFLAARSGAPLVPAAIAGADGIRRGGGFHRPPVSLRVGPAIDVAGAQAGGARGRALYEAVSRRAHDAVLALLGGA